MAGSAVAAPIIRHRNKGVVRISVACATDATADGGDITERVIGEGYGRIVACYSDGGFDASAVITISQAASDPGATVGAPLFTYTTGTEGTPAGFRPTAKVAGVDGTALTSGDGSGGAGTGNDANRDIYVAGKLTIKVDNMGVSETGLFVVVVDEAELHDGAGVTNT
jgi:hypothetical protein